MGPDRHFPARTAAPDRPRTFRAGGKGRWRGGMGLPGRRDCPFRHGGRRVRPPPPADPVPGLTRDLDRLGTRGESGPRITSGACNVVGLERAFILPAPTPSNPRPGLDPGPRPAWHSGGSGPRIKSGAWLAGGLERTLIPRAPIPRPSRPGLDPGPRQARHSGWIEAPDRVRGVFRQELPEEDPNVRSRPQTGPRARPGPQSSSPSGPSSVGWAASASLRRVGGAAVSGRAAGGPATCRIGSVCTVPSLASPK